MVDQRLPTVWPAVTRSSVIALVATLALATGCWVATLLQMRGMDMGVATDLGSFGAFLAVWVPMMTAMMLPGVVPIVMQRARSMSAARSISLFVVVYVAVWTVVGIAVFVLYRPHSTTAAGVLLIAAGSYELTPLKTRCRRRCQTTSGSGTFSLACVGSSIGLMVAFIALGFMSVTWMVVTAVVLLVQKLVPAHRAVDVPVALAIVALGFLALTTPSSVPGLLPAM